MFHSCVERRDVHEIGGETNVARLEGPAAAAGAEGAATATTLPVRQKNDVRKRFTVAALLDRIATLVEERHIVLTQDAGNGGLVVREQLVDDLLPFELAIADAHGYFVVEFDAGLGLEWHECQVDVADALGEVAADWAPDDRRIDLTLRKVLLDDFPRVLLGIGIQDRIRLRLLLPSMFDEPRRRGRAGVYTDDESPPRIHRKLEQICARLDLIQTLALGKDEDIGRAIIRSSRPRLIVSGGNAHYDVAPKVLARQFVPQRVADEIHPLRKRIILNG